MSDIGDADADAEVDHHLGALDAGQAAIMSALRAHVAEFEAEQATPLPHLVHRCKVVRSGIISGRLVRRCRCGAINTGRGWRERNTARKHWRRRSR